MAWLCSWPYLGLSGCGAGRWVSTSPQMSFKMIELQQLPPTTQSRAPGQPEAVTAREAGRREQAAMSGAMLATWAGTGVGSRSRRPFQAGA